MNNVFLLQLDGLSGPVLDYAFKENLMPFTKSLLEQGWKKRDFFCGLPSTTPASQINLLYGLNNLIPGFSFYIKSNKQIVTPFHPETLLAVEAIAAAKNPNSLVKDGASIFTLFTGNAKTSVSMSGITKDKKNIRHALGFFVNPLRVFGFLVKICIYLIIEHKEHKTLVGEHTPPLVRLFFIVKRMVEEIADGELAYYFSKKMISEGRPVIYVDFTGYDEIAHDYTPFGKFSLYYLSMLDVYIKGCYRAIEKSKRAYELVILSDHGQTTNKPYKEVAKEELEASIVRLYPQCRLKTQKGDLDFFLKQESDLVINHTGNIFLLYDVHAAGKLTREQFEQTYPDFFRKVSQLPGIGHVVGRTHGKSVIVTKGKESPLAHQPGSPFFPTLDDTTNRRVVEHLELLLAAEFGADVYLIGEVTKEYSVALTVTPGIHGGIGGDQTHAFILSRHIGLPEDINDFSDIYRAIYGFIHSG